MKPDLPHLQLCSESLFAPRGDKQCLSSIWLWVSCLYFVYIELLLFALLFFYRDDVDNLPSDFSGLPISNDWAIPFGDSHILGAWSLMIRIPYAQRCDGGD